MEDSKKLYEAVLHGNVDEAAEAAKEGLDAGTDPLSLVNGQLIPAMDEVGRRFQEQEYFVPDLLLAARAMKPVLDIITPLLVEQGRPYSGCVILGTVQGDLHDIGKNLVGALLEGAGFKVIDLGVNVAPAKFVEAVRNEEACIVAMSALLTTTLPSMQATIEALKAAGLREQTKVVVGGSPVSQDFADAIGADGYCQNAVEAVALAKQFVGG